MCVCTCVPVHLCMRVLRPQVCFPCCFLGRPLGVLSRGLLLTPANYPCPLPKELLWAAPSLAICQEAKGESGNNQRPRMSISTSITQAQSRKDPCPRPGSLQKHIWVVRAAWAQWVHISRPTWPGGTADPEHMDRGTESRPPMARQLEETQCRCFAHALKRPEDWSPFGVLKTGTMFQKEVIYHLKLRLQAPFHLTSL